MRWSTTLPASGCCCANCATCGPIRPSGTVTSGSRSSAKPNCCSGRSSARIAASIDLLDADFTFVDERLARHYGIPGVRGSRMRRVALPAGRPAARSAWPGQHPHRHVGGESNVAGHPRQVGARERARCAAAAPPPGVETNLEKDAAQVKVTSLRQRMELHRANPACASCHKLMDPIGFSLENFDNTGKWRTVDGTATIDASGALRTGRS